LFPGRDRQAVRERRDLELAPLRHAVRLERAAQSGELGDYCGETTVSDQRECSRRAESRLRRDGERPGGRPPLWPGFRDDPRTEGASVGHPAEPLPARGILAAEEDP